MKNKQRTHFVFAGEAWVLAGLFLCWGSLAQAQPRKSAEELLEYTLNDLQESMKMLAEKNGRMEAKNDALRKRILLLREESRKIEDEKLKMLEEFMNISGEDDLDLRDHQLGESKTQFILKREAWLKEEQEAIAKRVKDQQSRAARLKNKIKDNEARLARLQEEQQTPQVSLTRKKMQTEKATVLELIGETESRLESVRVQKMLLDRDISQKGKEQERMNAQVVLLREKAGALGSQIKQSQRQEQKLKDQAAKIERERTRTIKKAQMDVQMLKAERDQALKTLGETRDVVAGVSAEAKKDQEQLRKIFSSLEDEAGVLAQRKGVLTEALAVHKEFLRMVKALPDEASGAEPKTAALEAREEDKGDLLKQISEQNVRKKEMLQEKAELENELRRLEARKTAAHRQSQMSREQVLSKRERETREDVSQWERTVERRKAEVTRTERESEDWASRLADLEIREKELKEQKKALEEGLLALNEEKLRLEGGTRAAAQMEGKSVRQMEREIKDLQMRSTLLSGSLAVIQSRFDAKDMEVREFQGDEAQLREYLRVLREENSGLTDKLTALSVAAEKLTAQKKILKGRGGASGEKNSSVIEIIGGDRE